MPVNHQHNNHHEQRWQHKSSHGFNAALHAQADDPYSGCNVQGIPQGQTSGRGKQVGKLTLCVIRRDGNKFPAQGKKDVIQRPAGDNGIKTQAGDRCEDAQPADSRPETGVPAFPAQVDHRHDRALAAAPAHRQFRHDQAHTQ